MDRIAATSSAKTERPRVFLGTFLLLLGLADREFSHGLALRAFPTGPLTEVAMYGAVFNVDVRTRLGRIDDQRSEEKAGESDSGGGHEGPFMCAFRCTA